MVRLDRITTGTGDKGTTSLADGTRVPKNSLRVKAYGTVDELNCLLGVVRQEALPAEIDEELGRIQNDLFDLGADIAAPLGMRSEEQIPRIDEKQVKRLEAAVAAGTAQLEPATSFVLPGGSRTSAWLHLARAVTRRSERQLWALAAAEGEGAINSSSLVYLNRLSDLCFVWARLCNDGGKKDVLWEPGKNR